MHELQGIYIIIFIHTNETSNFIQLHNCINRFLIKTTNRSQMCT
uniref:Uncharacterized protein n=1 Tax=Anguilla anguilla TaxID=7936 RepID=A0A0E9WHP9_ANGAN